MERGGVDDPGPSTQTHPSPAAVSPPSSIPFGESQEDPTQSAPSLPPSAASEDVDPSEIAEEPPQLRRRPRHPPDHYTPGSK